MNSSRVKIWFWLAYLSIYVLSYFYLSYYHETFNLFFLNIHESGEVNFVNTMFYSSHFLAHLPVHVVLAFVFVGVLKLFNERFFEVKKSWRLLGGFILTFILVTFLHSFFVHGKTDTFEYILQKKQGHDIYGEGGSWKLHLVSTISVLFLIPLYVFVGFKFLGVKTQWNKKYFFLMIAGVLFIPVFSFLCEGNFLPDLKYAFTNNRYLAHSVRELATFPVTYFPLFFLVYYNFEKIQFPQKIFKIRRIPVFVWGSFFIFLILFAYQVYLPLTEGIGNLSQKPEFTKGDSLPILYLLSSHYFEHFLDTIFFALFAGLLYKIS